MDEIHHLFRPDVRRKAIIDEQTDHLAFARLGLFPNYGKVGRDARELERAFDGVVVGQCESIESALMRAIDQLLKRALPIVREMRMEMKVDAEHAL